MARHVRHHCFRCRTVLADPRKDAFHAGIVFGFIFGEIVPRHLRAGRCGFASQDVASVPQDISFLCSCCSQRLRACNVCAWTFQTQPLGLVSCWQSCLASASSEPDGTDFRHALVLLGCGQEHCEQRMCMARRMDVLFDVKCEDQIRA